MNINKEWFEDLTYQGRLSYWDEVGISFQNETHWLSDDTFVSVRPNGTSELVCYNRWIIDHWRHHFFNEGHQLNTGFNTLYKPYKGLVTNFDKLMEFKDRKDVIEDEIHRMNHLIISLQIKSRLLRLVYKNVKNLNEDDIYRFEFKSTSVLINLKDIAKVLDMVKYLVYLKNERFKLQEKKHSNVHFSFAPLSKNDSEAAYDFLVKEKFIHEDTDRDCFVNLLGNEVVPESFFIKWIDKAPFGKEVNKHTLFQFVDWMIDMGDKDQRAFIRRYFKTFNLYVDIPILKDITSRNITDSKKDYNKGEQVSDRQQQILDFVKPFLIM